MMSMNGCFILQPVLSPQSVFRSCMIQGRNLWFNNQFDIITSHMGFIQRCYMWVKMCIYSEFWPSPVTLSLLDAASSHATFSLPSKQAESEAWGWIGNPCCERSASMWGKKEDSGQSGEVYFANTWSCSGRRLASLQTLWHNVEKLWQVFDFSWLSWLFSVISFSLSVFSLLISHCRLYKQSSFLLRQRWAARRFLLRRLISWTNSNCSRVKTCCFSSCWKSFLPRSTIQSTENGNCTCLALSLV